MHSTSNFIRESPADCETISSSRKKAHEAQTKPNFSRFIDHKKLYPNNEDSKYMRNHFTSPTFTKMSISRTQNEITLKGSDIVFAKIKKGSKAALLNHL